MKEPLIIENLELHIGNRTLISSGNVSIAYGTKVALVGRNSSGKSTLLRTIMSLVSQGNAEMNAYIAAGRISIPPEMSCALIPQDPILPDSDVESYIDVSPQDIASIMGTICYYNGYLRYS